MWGMPKETKIDPLIMGPHPHHIHFRLPPHPRHAHLLHRHPMDLVGQPSTSTNQATTKNLWATDSARRRRFEPFCSPLVPHVPIRERLARRGTSVDVADEIPGSSSYLNSFYGPPRRRRMSLLQTLRQQNRQLNDSGFDVNRQRTESESTNRDTCSPPAKTSPPQSPSKKALASLKAKIFGKKDKRQNAQAIGIEDGNGRSRKSPSTTNDSGRGSQGHLEERNPFATNEIDAQRRQSHERKKVLRLRTSSCPCLPGLCDLPHKNGEDSDGDVDGIGDDEEIFPERMLRNSSPVSAADCLLERRLMRRAVEVERRRLLESVSLSHSSTSHHNQSHRPRATIAM